jgi:glutamate N-acetyltransferase/amino-acid N-acetyltransferase
MVVTGAPEEEDAAAVARTIVGSPLVKTSVYGEDPNWGRIVAAAGRAGVEFDPYAVSLSIGEGDGAVPIMRQG